MYLNNIRGINFRNYENFDILLNKNKNIFIGNNGEGKTNILESIYVLGLTKSHRFFKDDILLKKNSSSMSIEGEVIENNNKFNLKLIYKENKKTVYKNEIKIDKIRNYISNLNIIIFTPDDLNIIKDSPNIRRKFLNIEICQLSKNYINKLNKYNYLLKMKNEYLKKEKKDFKYIEIINEKLIEVSIDIYNERILFVNDINFYLSDIYKDLSGINNLYIEYKNNLNIDDFSRQNIKEFLSFKYKEILEKEILQKKTLFGPHKDDFKFIINDNDLKFFGSQGQQRLAVLALKLSEINLYKNKKKIYPIILLDDIFSELDNEKKKNILKYLDDDFQVIITTTDLDNIDNSIIKNSSIFNVDNGKIFLKEEGVLNDRK